MNGQSEKKRRRQNSKFRMKTSKKKLEGGFTQNRSIWKINKKPLDHKKKKVTKTENTIIYNGTFCINMNKIFEIKITKKKCSLLTLLQQRMIDNLVTSPLWNERAMSNEWRPHENYIHKNDPSNICQNGNN